MIVQRGSARRPGCLSAVQERPGDSLLPVDIPALNGLVAIGTRQINLPFTKRP